MVGEALGQKAGVGFRGECQLQRGLMAPDSLGDTGALGQ